MKILRKSFFIVVPVIVVIVLIFMFGIRSYNNKYTSFQAEGHIIAQDTKSTTAKHYFDSDTKYKLIDDQVVITPKEEDSITIPSDTFIHYADGAISTFKKSVVLNLENMNKDNYTYYNIFPETIFVKNGNEYSVNYLDKKLKFTRFLLKINEEKFMIVGPKIILKIGDVERSFDNTYLEVSYLDGNVIRVENQSAAFQSVSDEVLISVDDKTIIDFVGKNIYNEQTRKLSLSEITIDSDDNIVINKEDNLSITGEKTNNSSGNSGKGQSVGGNSSSSSSSSSSSASSTKKYTKEELPDISNGVVDTTEDNREQIIDENARIKDAEFTIVNFNVTANSIRAGIQVKDTDAVLEDELSIKILEANTNKIIHEEKKNSGDLTFDIEDFRLSPETNYILIVNSDYKKNGVTYNKDFIQKTFITDPIGVELEKYYVSEKKIEVNISKKDYSEVTKVNVNLEDTSGNVIKKVELPLENAENLLEFDDLTNDTSYKVRVYDFSYEYSPASDGYTILKTYETLKRRPTIGDISFSMDKKESHFTMMVNNMIDPDGGITSYKYEIYDQRKIIAGEDPKPITVIEKNSNSSATLKVDDKIIERGVPYVFRVSMTFNDNEKEYDYVTGFSDAMKLDGVVFPVVRFNKTEVTFEKIVGEIEIIDDGNTIDINSGQIITVQFKDSVGNLETRTSSGSYRIPINENNLRKNETYIFSVYTKVDLQDGNPPIDNQLVGNVIVKTEEPDPFQVSFQSIENVSLAFSVDAQLKKGNKGDTELEANTLSGISFNLYQGRGTSGKLVKTVKSVDRNLQQYESELRDVYYDNLFRLDPNFFGLRNSDLTSEYYTVEITSAYDYTTHQNELPIYNNTYTFKVKTSLPDMPVNPENSVDIIPIRNYEMGVNKRNDLDDSTIVGYKFRTSFNNSSKAAKKVTYDVKDDEGNVLKTIVYEVPPNGDINYSEITVADGLKFGESDDKLRRGMGFYISYTIELDMDYDGVIDTTYPLSGLLRSVVTNIPKQSPNVLFYPSTSDETQYIWKYKYIDVDHSLVDQKVTAYLDGDEIGSVVLENSNSYKLARFPINSSGVFSIYGDYQLNNKSPIIIHQFTSQYYEGVKSENFGKVLMYPEKNRIIFSFEDYANKEDLFSKIANAKIEFKTSDKSIVIDGINVSDQNITVNYSEIEELQGKNISPIITLYYDNGTYGFDNEGSSFAIQQIRSSMDSPTYYYRYSKDKIETIDRANSYVSYVLNLDNLTFNVKDIVTKKNYNSNIFITDYGINYQGGYISPKKLSSVNVNFNGDSSFKFNTIVPGISILNDDNLTDISPLISSSSFHFTTFGVDNKLRDDKVYVELYKLDSPVAIDGDFVNVYEFSLTNFKNGITISDLIPNTNYYVKVFGYVLDSDGGYEKSYLYDIDKQIDGANYYFKTLGNIGLTNLTVRYSASSYDMRRLRVGYSLEKTIGFQYIRFLVYKIIGDEKEIYYDVKTDDSTVFKEHMIERIPISNEDDFYTGEVYFVEAIPVIKGFENGEEVEYELDSTITTFKFNDLFQPYFIINQNTTDSSIIYRVNCKDYSRSIVDGVYQIQILDAIGNDVTPDEYVSKEFNIDNVNQTFILDDITSSSQYTFNILFKADFHNDINRIEDVVKSINSSVGTSSTINLGNVYADTDMEDQTKINLRFFDSERLSDAKKIRYSIYNESGYSSDNEVSFNPVSQAVGETSFFSFQLPDSISSDGLYYISMQFLDNDGVILAETTVEYRLI